MARRWLRIGTLMLALAGLAGCAPGNPGMVVLGVLAPNSQCLYDTANQASASGLLDVSGGAGYVAGVRYGNQLINLGENGTGGPPMADPNVIVVQELEVELQDVGGNGLDLGGLPNPYTVPAGGGAIPSSDGTSFGEGIGVAQLIPPVYSDALAGGGDTTIVVQIQAVGTTLGDAEVVSPPFTFPVNTCNGCLFGCPRDADGSAVCRAACFPGQDSFQSNCPEFADGSCVIGG